MIPPPPSLSLSLYRKLQRHRDVYHFTVDIVVLFEKEMSSDDKLYTPTWEAF